MWDRLLPRRAGDDYPGHASALWLFGLLVLLKAAISLNSIFNGRSVAGSADGIALDAFSPDGARAVISLFALWGLAHLVLCLLGALVLARYRAMVALMFALLLLEHLGRRLILAVMPIARTGPSPGSAVNVGLLVLMAVGLTLALWRRPEPVERG